MLIDNDSKIKLYFVKLLSLDFYMNLLPAKEQYFVSIANKHNVSVDTVRSIAYGDNVNLANKIVINILMEFVNNNNEMYIAMIWEGQASTSVYANVPYYDYIGQVIEGLNLRLYRTSYTAQLFLCNSVFADYAYFEKLIAKHPNAGFAVLVSDNVAPIQKACQDYSRPLIFLNQPTDTDLANHYMVSIEEKTITAEMVRYLHGLGHRRIAYIHGFLSHKPAYIRLEGYYQGLKSVGLQQDKSLVYAGNWRKHKAKSATKQLLSLDDSPTAIMVANDLMAISVIDAIKDAGLRVPQDISVVGFDDIASAVQNDPPLTTARIPMTQLGREMGNYMITLLEGNTPSPQHRYFPVEFIIRESTFELSK